MTEALLAISAALPTIARVLLALLGLAAILGAVVWVLRWWHHERPEP